MRRSILAGLIAAVLGVALVRADGINIPAPSWAYLVPASVQTALQIAVGSAGGPVTFNGAGGTPSSMTATNLSGTAASLTAGNVTTNANLTGEVTSVGNATTIAASARLKSKIITGSRNLTTATGNVAYTGIGFTPTSCMFFGNVAGSPTYTVFSGISDSALGNATVYVNATGTFNSTNAAGVLVFADAVGTSYQYATTVSYDADGFTLGWNKVGTPTGTANFSAICFR